MRGIAYGFPSNNIRTMALRACGFEIGKDVYVASGLRLSMMNSEKSCFLKIGDRVSIGPGVILILASDPNNSVLKEHFKPVRGKIEIGNDTWLGAGAIVLPNVQIGECSVVSAGAVVTKDIPSRTVVAGVPAKAIKEIGQAN